MKSIFKSIIKHKIFAILLAIVIGFTCVLGGLTYNSSSVRAANLPEMSDLTFSTDLNGKPLIKGKSFNLIMTFSSKRTNTYWSAIDISVGPLNADKTDFDVNLAKKLTVPTHYDDDWEDDLYNIDFGDININNYNIAATGSHLHNDVSAEQYGCFRLGIYHEKGKKKPSTENVVIKIEFVVADDINAESLTFGVIKKGKVTASNGVGFGEDQTSDAPVDSSNNAGILTTNDLVIEIIDEEDDTSIDTLEIGPSADKLELVDLANSPYSYVFDEFMSSMLVKPTLGTELSTAKLGLVPDGGSADTFVPTISVASGNTATVPIPNGNGTLVVDITSQSGKTDRYVVNIVMSYVRLSNIAVSLGDGAPSTLGLQGTFDKDTFTYSVHLPDAEGGSSAKITATVLDGFGINETIALTGTNCTVDATGTSGTEFDVTGIADGATLKLTATAADGTTTQDYTLNFATLSTDAEIKTIQAVGVEKTYDNNSEKATENSVHYYFYLTDEDTPEAKFAITVATGATVKITDSENNDTTYDDSTKDNKYAVGTYTITVTAAAGNSATYTVILAAPELIELNFDSDYLFLFEQEDGTFKYRRAYIEPEFGYVHGVHDKDWECHIVLGNIPLQTTINVFLSNIKATLLPYLKIYSNKDKLYYDRGNEGADFPESASFDSTLYSVGTGWRLELCPDGVNSIDTIYLSVLGDVTGDGVLSTQDTARLTTHMQGKYLEGAEYFLAAYVTNKGAISTQDPAALTSVMNGSRAISSYVKYILPES